MRRRLLGKALGLGLGLALTTRVDALELTLRDCPALSEAALREHLELELQTLALSTTEVDLLLECSGTSVRVQVAHAGAEPYPVTANVQLRDTARAARERLVALAASELVAQVERSPQVVEQPKTRLTVAPLRRDSPAIEPRPASRRASSIELAAAGHVALAGAPSTLLWGGTLGTRFGLSRRWALLLDTRFERGQSRESLADVRWSSLSGCVGVALNGALGPGRASAGLGVRAGWLSLAATAREPNQGLGFTAPWLGVAVPLRLAFELGGALAPFAAAEGGYVTLPVRGRVSDGATLIEQRGTWLALGLGVAAQL